MQPYQSLKKHSFSKLDRRQALSIEGKSQISNLAKRDPIPFLVQLILAWSIIVSAIWLALYLNNIFVNIFVIFIVATRQNILGLLVHEQVHCLGFKARFGDKFTNFFVAYPLLILTIEDYSQAHLSHHKFFMSDQDQDLYRKSGKNWQFPMRTSHLLKLFLADIICLNLWKMIKGKKLNIDTNNFKRPNRSPNWVRPVYFLLMALIISYTHSWGIFLLFWVVPLLTFGQVILRWGAICEHQYIHHAKIEECSPLIILSWWEKLLLPNLNFTLHPYHHFYPGVPFSKLPDVHQIFLKEGLIIEDHIFKGNISYLRFILEKESVSLRNVNYKAN